MKSIVITKTPKELLEILEKRTNTFLVKEKLGKAISTLIKENGKVTIYLCCSKAKNKDDFLGYDTFNGFYGVHSMYNCPPLCLNEKIVCKFELKELYKIVYDDEGFHTKFGRSFSKVINKDYTHAILIEDLIFYPKSVDEFWKGFHCKRVTDSLFFDNELKVTERGLRQHIKNGYEYVQKLRDVPKYYCYVEEV